jgi:hypothetical protein
MQSELFELFHILIKNTDLMNTTKPNRLLRQENLRLRKIRETQMSFIMRVRTVEFELAKLRI